MIDDANGRERSVRCHKRHMTCKRGFQTKVIVLTLKRLLRKPDHGITIYTERDKMQALVPFLAQCS